VAADAGIHSDRRLPSLTGLRIAAALAVYASHVGAPSGSPELVSTFFRSGYCGVTVFFVLSGFVLSFNYFEEMRKPNPAGLYEFFLARFARIYPLYLLVLLYVVVRQQALTGEADGWWEHVLALQAWDGSVDDAYAFNGPGWSIGVEFFLYACFPLLIPLVAWLRGTRELLLAAGVVAMAMVGLALWFVLSGKGALPALDPASAHRWLYRTPLTRLGDFLLGILAARLFVQVGGLRAIGDLGRWLASAGAVAIVVLMSWPALVGSAWSFDVAYAVPAVLLIFGLAVAPTGWLARGLSLPAVVLLGEASYAFYLVHLPAIGLLGAGQWANGVSGSIALLEAFNLGVIVMLAIGLHLFFERPSRRWLRGRLSLPRRRPESDPQSRPALDGATR
jgi:peptidoglycan/LPS O-acetylase OafA/YrhL